MSQQINLYNPAFERKRDLLSFPGAVAAWGAALGLVIVVMLALTLRSSNLEHKLAQTAAERDAAQADMTRLAAQLAARKANPELAAEVHRLEAALASRKEVMSTLRGGVIGDTRGFSAHLAAFARQSFSGLWLTGLKVANAGQDVVLEGRAMRPELVPNYLRRLNREEVMRGHAFAELEMRRPVSAEAAVQAQAKYIEFRLSTLSSVAAADSRGRQ
ncbi:MAG: PilN domain-containing protein [Betaproteobacteria bacterium]|nr:MAG: PilN domain-containing protein [Betaproteobacteria bacterium]